LTDKLASEEGIETVLQKKLKTFSIQSNINITSPSSTETAKNIGQSLDADYVVDGKIEEYKVEAIERNLPYIGKVYDTFVRIKIKANLINVSSNNVILPINVEVKRVEPGFESKSYSAFDSKSFQESTVGVATIEISNKIIQKIKFELFPDEKEEAIRQLKNPKLKSRFKKSILEQLEE